MAKGVPNVRGSLELLNSEFKVQVQLELWTLVVEFRLDSSWTIELSNLEFKFVELWTLELRFESSSSWNSELNSVGGRVTSSGWNRTLEPRVHKFDRSVNYWTSRKKGCEFEVLEVTLGWVWNVFGRCLEVTSNLLFNYFKYSYFLCFFWSKYHFV